MKLPYFLEINKDLLRIEPFQMWQKNSETLPGSIIGITGEPIVENGWYDQLSTFLNQEITLLNNVCSNAINIVYNTSYKDNDLAADTMARLIYKSCTNNTKVLLIHFNDIRYYEKVKITNIIKLYRSYYFESLYSPYNLRAFFNFVRNFQLIESICKEFNIKMYWTSNCYFIRKLPKKYLKQYLNTNCFFVSPSSKNYHKKVANKFYKFITRAIE